MIAVIIAMVLMAQYGNYQWLSRSIVMRVPVLRSIIQAGSNYHWLFHSIVLGNLKRIYAYPHLTYDQKMELRFGMGYKLVQYVRAHTPEDAAILAPEDKELAEVGLDYYLYPRYIIQWNAQKHPMYSKATHIMVFKGKGYEYLKNPPSDRIEYGLITVAPGDLAMGGGSH